MGIVEQTRATHDRRILKLTLSPAALKVYNRWGQEVRRYLV
jgi:hypothetical protein